MEMGWDGKGEERRGGREKGRGGKGGRERDIEGGGVRDGGAYIGLL